MDNMAMPVTMIQSVTVGAYESGEDQHNLSAPSRNTLINLSSK